MKFNDLIIKLHESEQTGPPYIVRGETNTIYYADPSHKIMHRDEKDPETGKSLPAYISDPDRMKTWWINGKRHREDGPAREWKNTNVKNKNFKPEWWMNGVLLTDEQVEELKKKLAIKNDIQSHKNNRIDPGMLNDYL